MMCVLWAADGGVADTLYRNDGTVLRGRVRSQDETAVAFQVDLPGGALVVTVPREDIRLLTRQDADKPEAAAPARPAATRPRLVARPAGPGYYMLPIRGEIGVEVTAEALEHALLDAGRKAPDFLILDIDCPGGSVQEAGKILAVLANVRGPWLVAYVRRAEWAGAAVALGCRYVVMAPGATIGSPPPVRADGVAQPIDRRLEGAMLALLRTGARIGSHSTLIALGMLDTDLELSVQMVAGRPTIVEGRQGRVLKTRGTALTLSATQAVAAGLAVGTARRVDDIRAALALQDWHCVTGDGWMYMIRKGADARGKWGKQQRLTVQQAYLDRSAPRLKEIEDELALVRAAGKAAEATIDDLKAQYEAEVCDVNREYRRSLQDARRLRLGVGQDRSYPYYRRGLGALTTYLDYRRGLDPRGGVYRVRQDANVVADATERATELRDIKMLEVRSRYQPQALSLKERINELYQQQQRLLDERQSLLDATPK